MLGYYNYTVWLTYISMLVSMLGMALAMEGHTVFALICLMVSGLFDMFDGKVASTKKNRTLSEKRYGIQIDSLSDVICFGVLPATIVYKVTAGSLVGMVAAGLYTLGALIRLAWFNVDEEERQASTEGAREVYSGLPVTSAALIIPAVFGLALYEGYELTVIGPAVLVLMAVAFVTPFHMRKPANRGKAIMIALGLIELFILIAGKWL